VKALHVREGRAQVVRQTLDDFGAPALLGLALQDVPTDLPIQRHQFAVDRQSRPLLGGVNAVFHFDQPVGIAGWDLGQRHRFFAHPSNASRLAAIRPASSTALSFSSDSSS
jgi:hypothetical protein